MVRADKAQWKSDYFLKLVQLFDEYPKCFMVSNSTRRSICSIDLYSFSNVSEQSLSILFWFDQVNADNVGSKQMQQIRMSLRGHAVVLMGKNTMMRKAIRGHLSQNPKLEYLLPHIVGNVGFVFTKEELVDVRDLLLANKVKAPARAGAIAPLDVTVPAQNTGLGPEKTSFFQALNIPTKITKGTIEIVTDVKLIKEGDKVGMSDSTLLNVS